MKSIYQYNISDLENEFINIGEKKFRASQVFEWIYRKEVYDFNEMTNLSKALRSKLSDYYDTQLLKIVEKQESNDGTIKYLLELNDGGLIETVLMIHPYGKSLCVTTQLGCSMACRFCASGLLKKVRNLKASEMVLQVLTVQNDLSERISHLVLMGTGEPFDNYDEVMNFIYIINNPKGLAIGARHITVSTCGIIPMINRFSNEGIQVNLAISLHAPNDDLRNDLMPINHKYNMDDLRDCLKAYIDKTNRRVTFEYILLKDVNDSLIYARQLAHYIRGLNAYVNLIPFNSVNESGFNKSDDKTIKAFKDELLRLKINCTLRKEHGSDIDGACGQLRAKRIGGHELGDR